MSSQELPLHRRRVTKDELFQAWNTFRTMYPTSWYVMSIFCSLPDSLVAVLPTKDVVQQFELVCEHLQNEQWPLFSSVVTAEQEPLRLLVEDFVTQHLEQKSSSSSSSSSSLASSMYTCAQTRQTHVSFTARSLPFGSSSHTRLVSFVPSLLGLIKHKSSLENGLSPILFRQRMFKQIVAHGLALQAYCEQPFASFSSSFQRSLLSSVLEEPLTRVPFEMPRSSIPWTLLFWKSLQESTLIPFVLSSKQSSDWLCGVAVVANGLVSVWIVATSGLSQAELAPSLHQMCSVYFLPELQKGYKASNVRRVLWCSSSSDIHVRSSSSSGTSWASTLTCLLQAVVLHPHVWQNAQKEWFDPLVCAGLAQQVCAHTFWHLEGMRNLPSEIFLEESARYTFQEWVRLVWEWPFDHQIQPMKDWMALEALEHDRLFFASVQTQTVTDNEGNTFQMLEADGNEDGLRRPSEEKEETISKEEAMVFLHSLVDVLYLGGRTKPEGFSIDVSAQADAPSMNRVRKEEFQTKVVPLLQQLVAKHIPNVCMLDVYAQGRCKGLVLVSQIDTTFVPLPISWWEEKEEHSQKEEEEDMLEQEAEHLETALRTLVGEPFASQYVVDDSFALMVPLRWLSVLVCRILNPEHSFALCTRLVPFMQASIQRLFARFVSHRRVFAHRIVRKQSKQSQQSKQSHQNKQESLSSSSRAF